MKVFSTGSKRFSLHTVKEDFGFAANGLRFSHNYHSEGEDPGVGEVVCLFTIVLLQ